MVNDNRYAADRCAFALPPKGKRPKPPASTRPRCCAGNGGPHGARSLKDRVVWIPARPSDPADLEAWCRRKAGLLAATLRAFGARKCRWPRDPDNRVVLLVPRGSPGRFERPRRPGALRCCAKSVKKNAHGFFLASCGEAFGSRKKLQGKDLQKQKRCGLLECSCEDVRSSLAGGGELSTSRNSRR